MGGQDLECVANGTMDCRSWSSPGAPSLRLRGLLGLRLQARCLTPSGRWACRGLLLGSDSLPSLPWLRSTTVGRDAGRVLLAVVPSAGRGCLTPRGVAGPAADIAFQARCVKARTGPRQGVRFPLNRAHHASERTRVCVAGRHEGSHLPDFWTAPATTGSTRRGRQPRR